MDAVDVQTYNIHVDSTFRSSGTISNFKYNVVKINKYKDGYITLKTLEFPTGSVNQFQSYNNKIIYSYNSQANPTTYTDVSFSLTPANYSMSEFLTALQNEITNNFTGFTLSYDEPRGKIYITKTSADAWRSLIIRGTTYGTTANIQLGISTSDITIDTQSVNVYMPNEADLLPLKYIYLCSNVLTNNDTYATSVGGNQILHKILLVGSRNTITFYENQSLNENKLHINFPSSDWSFSLLDKDNNFLEMNGLNFSFTLWIKPILS